MGQRGGRRQLYYVGGWWWGGQYPTRQPCQASHLERRGKQIVIWAGRGHVEGALRCWALLPLPWDFLPPNPFPCLRLGLGGLMASLGWGQASGFVIPTPTH